MTTLFLKPKELEAIRWNGENKEEIQELCAGRGPRMALDTESPREDGCKFQLKRASYVSIDEAKETMPRLTHGLRVWNGKDWIEVEPGWWVVRLEDGNMGRMSPDYVDLYCQTELPNELKMYYKSYRAAMDRVSRVALGVESLAMELSRIQPNLARFVQDKLRQLLCTHPEGARRYGHAESWCSICFVHMKPENYAAPMNEVMAHVVTWCKCKTEACPVHKGPRSDLPPPTMLVPAIPESVGNPELAPVAELNPVAPAKIGFEDGEEVILKDWSLNEVENNRTANTIELSGRTNPDGNIDLTKLKRIMVQAEVPGEELPLGQKVTVETESRPGGETHLKIWWRKS